MYCDDLVLKSIRNGKHVTVNAMTINMNKKERDTAVEVLIRSFMDDPVYRCVFSDPVERRRSLKALWNALVRYCELYGVIHTTSELNGVVCWLPPGNTRMTFMRHLRTGFVFIRAVKMFQSKSRKKCLHLLSHIDDLHKRIMTRPHWYLWVLGVDPSARGQGIGGRLLEPVLSRADADGAPCYLETQSEWNVAFYERRGFSVISIEVMDDLGLKIWIMVREPRPHIMNGVSSVNQS